MAELDAKLRYKYLPPEVMAKLANVQLIAKYVVEGFIAGLHRSPYHGFSVEFAEYREYTPGDDLKHLDWKVVGKCDRYYIKQYQEETNLRCYILLDTSASMAYQSGKALAKLEYGSYLAASLAFLMTRQQDAVGLIRFSDEMEKFIPPRSGPAHLREILIDLENVKPSKSTAVARSMHALAENMKKRSLVVVISDFFDETAGIFRGLRHFRHNRHEVVAFHLFDEAELSFPFEALAQFKDLETGQKLQVHPALIRDEYVERIAEYINDYRKFCSDNEIDYKVVNTHMPFEFLLTTYLAKRMRLM